MVVELPQEIIDKIIDEIAGDGSFLSYFLISALKACSVVSSAWHHRSRNHLFRRIWFSNRSFLEWCTNVRPGEDGPSRHVTFIGFRPRFTVDLIRTSPSHISSFTNLQTLELHQISLLGDEDAVYLGDLGRAVRELRLQQCSMTIDWFVQFLKQLTNLEDLHLSDIRTPSIPKLKSLDRSELPHLKGALEIGMSHMGWKYFAEFISQLAVLPSALHTIVLFGYNGVPAEVNELFATCKRTLARLEFRDCESPTMHPALARLIQLSGYPYFRCLRRNQPGKLRCSQRVEV